MNALTIRAKILKDLKANQITPPFSFMHSQTIERLVQMITHYGRISNAKALDDKQVKSLVILGKEIDRLKKVLGLDKQRSTHRTLEAIVGGKR